MNSKSIVNLDIIDQRVYKALIVGSIIGVIINLYYTIFFAFLGATVLSLINFFGIFIYSFVYYLVKNGSVKLPYLAVVNQIVVSCVLSSFYLGTESGFYYFIIIFIPITYLYTKWEVYEMLLITLFVFVGYLFSAFFELYFPPFLLVENEVLNNLFIGNIVCALISVVLVFYSFNRSIKQIEENLLEANKTLTLNNTEKNILLKEIHHRVKNNLHVVNSILEVQALEVKDDKLKSYLQDAQRRIISMATIHEKMYGSDNLKYISAKDYLSSLITDLQSIYDSEKNVNLELDFEDVELDLDTIAPLAFLVNEIVTNSFKHAFGNEKNHKIYGELKLNDDKISIKLGDNGSGFIEKLEKSNSSLGVDLIESFTSELEATCVRDLTNGVEYNFVFDRKLRLPEIKEK